MRILVGGLTVLALAACSTSPYRYDPDVLARTASANPIDRGTEFLRQVRAGEIERDKKAAGEKDTRPRLFKKQADERDEENAEKGG